MSVVCLLSSTIKHYEFHTCLQHMLQDALWLTWTKGCYESELTQTNRWNTILHIVDNLSAPVVSSQTNLRTQHTIIICSFTFPCIPIIPHVGQWPSCSLGFFAGDAGNILGARSRISWEQFPVENLSSRTWMLNAICLPTKVCHQPNFIIP